jgi:hypothetical protein
MPTVPGRKLSFRPWDAMVAAAVELAERGWLPDPLVRVGIRRLVRERLDEQRQSTVSVASFIERLKTMPIAVEVSAANPRGELTALFVQLHCPDPARRTVQRWRLFFLACAEMFAFASGTEWGIGHYRFVQRG